MGFMDKAKEAAEDLKASFASTEVRDSEQAYRDLGMLAYLTTTGRPIDEADRQRLVNTLWAIEQQGKLPAFRLVTSPPPPPPPPPPVPQSRSSPPRLQLRLRPRPQRRQHQRHLRLPQHPPEPLGTRGTARRPDTVAEPPPAEAPTDQPSGLSQAVTWCTKHHRQSSSGSADCMTGWVVSRKCAVACRITDESQQPMFPHSRQIRSETQV